jgi:hypothetical protein
MLARSNFTSRSHSDSTIAYVESLSIKRVVFFCPNEEYEQAAGQQESPCSAFTSCLKPGECPSSGLNGTFTRGARCANWEEIRSHGYTTSKGLSNGQYA